MRARRPASGLCCHLKRKFQSGLSWLDKMGSDVENTYLPLGNSSQHEKRKLEKFERVLDNEIGFCIIRSFASKESAKLKVDI